MNGVTNQGWCSDLTCGSPRTSGADALARFGPGLNAIIAMSSRLAKKYRSVFSRYLTEKSSVPPVSLSVVDPRQTNL
jgi:hypothetical protein